MCFSLLPRTYGTLPERMCPATRLNSLRPANQARPRCARRHRIELWQDRDRRWPGLRRNAGVAGRCQPIHPVEDRDAADHQQQEDRTRRVHHVYRSEAGCMDADCVVLASANAARPEKQAGDLEHSATLPTRTSSECPMKLKKLTCSMEELTRAFADMTDNGGKFVLMWDKEMATVRFKVGPQH